LESAWALALGKVLALASLSELWARRYPERESRAASGAVLASE
jgi:hypothetical protein